MLTPAQIRAHKFISAVRGSYKSEDVDSFFEDVLASYEQVFKENAELIKKISLLAERVEAYRNDEDNIKVTLLTAQRMADKMMRDANETSAEQLRTAAEKLEYAESHAKAQAQMIIDNANSKAQAEIVAAELQTKQIIEDAVKQSELISLKAKKDSLEQLEKTKEEIKNETLSLEILKREAAVFKGELLEKYRQHIEYIGGIPGSVDTFSQQKSKQEPDSTIVAEDTIAVEAVESVESVEEALTEEQEEFLFGEKEESDYEDHAELPLIKQDDFNAEEQKEQVSLEELDAFLKGQVEESSSENDEELQTEDEEVSEEDEAEYESESETEDEIAMNENDDDESKKTDDRREELDDGVSSVPKPVSFLGFSSDESKDEGEFPSLFTLRQRAMAQQQELSGTEANSEPDVSGNEPEPAVDYSFKPAVFEEDDEMKTDEVFESPDDDDDENDDEIVEALDSDESEGFKVFLENIDDDDDVSADKSEDEPAEKTGSFETVEYAEEDDDDDDGDSQPRFKGFFKK